MWDLFLAWAAKNAPDLIEKGLEAAVKEFRVEHPQLEPPPPPDEEASIDKDVDELRAKVGP